jgi:hypothetical protein
MGILLIPDNPLNKRKSVNNAILNASDDSSHQFSFPGFTK